MPVPRLFAVVLAALGLLWAGAAAAVPFWSYEVKATYPHDRQAYTQGLFWLDGMLYESTGQVGASTLRKVRLSDGAVLQRQPMSPAVFGEGAVNWGDEIISITWRDQVGFRWNLRTLALKSSFRYSGEGWGLTQNGTHLIMSDGTPVLKFLDPRTFKEVRRVTVKADGKPVANLNELEWVKGEVFANVWQTNYIVRIDPQSGAVKGVVDHTGLPETRYAGGDAVLNGIAYDPKADRLFVTGKLWPRLYEIRLKPKAPR